LEEMI